MRSPIAILAAVGWTLTSIAGCARTAVTAQQAPPPPLVFVGEWGAHGSGPGQLNRPESIATDFAGNIFVADSGSGYIHKFDPTGRPLLTFNEGVPHNPFRVSVDSGGGIYVLAPLNNSFFIYSPEGEPYRHHSIWPVIRHQSPMAISVDDEGEVFIIVRAGDSGGMEIRKYVRGGRLALRWQPETHLSGAKFIPANLAAASDGYLYVGDFTGTRVQKYSLDGAFIDDIGNLPQSQLQDDKFYSGQGIGVASKYIFAADSDIRGVRVWATDGQEKLKDDLGGRLANGQGPFRIAVSPRGELLVLDMDGARVLRFHINL